MKSLATNAPIDRQLPRTRVLLAGTLLSPAGAVSVRIRDISKGGAKLWADRPIADGCDAVFHIGSLFVAGHVAWSRGREAGVSFYRELSEDELTGTARRQRCASLT